jgi:hypothetical protein
MLPVGLLLKRFKGAILVFSQSQRLATILSAILGSQQLQCR